MRSWLGLLIPPPKGEGGPPSVARRVGWGGLLIARHSKLGPPPRLASLADPPPLRGGGMESVAPTQLNLSRIIQVQTVKITVSRYYWLAQLRV